MRRLIICFWLLPLMAVAQPAPPQFCISPTLAQSLASALQQDTAMLALLTEASQDSQRQAAAIAKAKADQKTEDEKTPPPKPEVKP